MTNMTHKSVDARKRRHARYKDAINPLREMFSCTAMQAAGHVRQVFAENAKLKSDLEQSQGEVLSLKARIEVLEEKLERKGQEALEESK